MKQTAEIPATMHVGAQRARHHNRRADVVRWLRKTHGWFGLWGAALGLMFGFSGIWLNHRAVLKLPPVAQQRSNAQISLPDSLPANPEAVARWLQQELEMDRPPSIRVERARPVPWVPRSRGDAGKPLMQPEHWTFRFGGPHSSVMVDAWAGNKSVSVHRLDNGVIGTLMNLHKGVGMSAAWILLIDTLAGSLIFLSLSGVILWVQTNRRRTVGTTILIVSVVALLALALPRI
ncbi:PepSY-associated TM helix domain-containing protein [Candidimonas humi]|uniref:PepSY-associated TM helix domain-containing protein n=1 Tax=Candidimonas humi TaxID=683355 RepID=A0ABV8NRY6_9BURK|nr:PepSY-associated TM helix domain-containing protein [Candidimonas humi]